MTFRDDPSYYESCYRCGDDAIGMTGLCHFCHESAESDMKKTTLIEIRNSVEAAQGTDAYKVNGKIYTKQQLIAYLASRRPVAN